MVSNGLRKMKCDVMCRISQFRTVVRDRIGRYKKVL
jgi:hypothetical protein